MFRYLYRVAWLIVYTVVAPPVRITTLFVKELQVVLRQRLLFGSLVAGPFLILLAFGLTFRGQQPQLTTLLVLPPEPEIEAWASAYASQPDPGFRIVGTTHDEAFARAEVLAGRVDVVVVVPAGVKEQLARGQRARLEIMHNLIDPARQDWLGFNTYVLTSELNRRVILDTLAAVDLKAIPPEVLVSPFESRTTDLASVRMSYVAFYTPGVLALILQHLGVTLGALALVRERLIGAIELFRVAPVSSLEILIGKSLAYVLVLVALGAALSLGARQWLGVPTLGPVEWLAGTLVLLSLASLGIGLAISAISRTELQAMQLAMLVLLASVFFSGFFVPITAFLPPALGIAYLLPVTHAVTALQSLMLRGQAPPLPPIYALVALVVIPYFVASLVFRRQLRLD